VDAGRLPDWQAINECGSWSMTATTVSRAIYAKTFRVVQDRLKVFPYDELLADHGGGEVEFELAFVFTSLWNGQPLYQAINWDE
jgi:hypothetical protein